MERLFQTHRFRKSCALAPTWTLRTLDAGGLDRPEKVLVPGVWESHPALRCYRGRGIYEQEIECGGNLRFWFGGVSFRARITLDNLPLGEHYGAYTGFEALALNIRRGMHVLRVEVDNRFDEDSALHVPNDYYAYGGIHRPVIVEELGRAYISECGLNPVLTENGWELQAEISVVNLTDNPFLGTVRVECAGERETAEIRLGGMGTGTCAISLKCGQVNPWTPEEPFLYEVKVVLFAGRRTVDDWLDRVGFRQIRVEGGQILLNGTPLQLRGFNRHEEYGSFGLAVPVHGMIQDLQMMREMGANCVRTCHYPNDPRFLDLCDEMGMLVWEESHARGFSEEQMRHPRFMDQLLQSSYEMVSQHRNHPSIFIWGCLNECADDTEYGAGIYADMLGVLRQMDGSRPVTAALLERPGGRVYADLDVISVNMYPKWYYDGAVEESLDRKEQEIRENGGKGKPIIISEIGAGAIYGCHDPLGEAKWSEEGQCKILREQITAILARPEICGIFVWQFADVRVSDEWAMNRPRTYNNKGVVDEFRRPKMAYRTVRELFRGSEKREIKDPGECPETE